MTRSGAPPGLDADRLVGRDSAVRAVRTRLEGGGRVVTITGAGGVGKSRVAHAVAAELASESHEVCVCALSDVTHAEGFWFEVARAASVNEGFHGKRSAVELGKRLAARGALTIVLDDADGVVARVAELVLACASVGHGPSFFLPDEGGNQGSSEIDLARHGSLRLVLDGLVAKRFEQPGVALSALALLAVGWPGERVRHESGMLRVYTAIRRLRALGFGRAVLTRDDGYLLDPTIRFERVT
jgi:hypothetical protein